MVEEGVQDGVPPRPLLRQADCINDGTVVVHDSPSVTGDDLNPSSVSRAETKERIEATVEGGVQGGAPPGSLLHQADSLKDDETVVVHDSPSGAGDDLNSSSASQVETKRPSPPADSVRSSCSGFQNNSRGIYSFFGCIKANLQLWSLGLRIGMGAVVTSYPGRAYMYVNKQTGRSKPWIILITAKRKKNALV